MLIFSTPLSKIFFFFADVKIEKIHKFQCEICQVCKILTPGFTNLLLVPALNSIAPFQKTSFAARVYCSNPEVLDCKPRFKVVILACPRRIHSVVYII